MATDKRTSELTNYTPALDADLLQIVDTANATTKKITWANIKATLKTYFDTLYASTLGADDNYVTDAEKVKLSNLSGTNTGDQTSIVGISGTKSQFNTACSDGNFLYVGDVTVPVKASGSELDTGTDDVKFATAKALKDSHNVPSVAPSTSGNVLTSNGTDWVSSPLATPVSSFPTQDIPLLTGTSQYIRSNMTSNATGTVLYVGYGITTSWIIDRFAKDSSTSNYYKTHTVTLTINDTDVQGGLAIVGNYLYSSNVVGGFQQVTRYLASDLSGVQVMTISGTKTYGPMFSDGTNLFISDSGATDNWTKYTISGTTITNAGTVAFTGTVVGAKGSISDGTNVWIGDARTGTLNIRKYPIAGGSATSTTTLIINANAYLNAGTTYLPLGLFLTGSTFLGIGFIYNQASATAVVGSLAHLQAITLP